MRRDHEALGDHEVRDEARSVASLVGPSLGRDRDDDASAAAARDALANETREVSRHVRSCLARIAVAEAAKGGDPDADFSAIDTPSIARGVFFSSAYFNFGKASRALIRKAKLT